MVASNSECIFVKWHDIFQQQWIFAALLIFFQHNLGWLGSRVWDVIQNRYKNHLLGAIVCDFWGWRLIFWSYVIMQDICNIFIEINFCFGCMVWPWLRLFQHRTFVKYWRDNKLLCYIRGVVINAATTETLVLPWIGEIIYLYRVH